MKRRLITAALLGLFGGTSGLANVPAQANNRSVELALANYGDISMFYEALLNTGVLAELKENTHYTIFAPTNAAFAQIRPSRYPCFYAVECRPQLAEVLRDHIVTDGRTINELERQGAVSTLGQYRVYVGSPYVGEYSIGNHRMLSEADVEGNVVYRIDGVILASDQMARFRAAPVADNTVTEEKTTVTYHTPDAAPVPGGVAYPEGSTETVTQKTYTMPDPALPGGAAQSTTVTRTITTRPADSVQE